MLEFYKQVLITLEKIKDKMCHHQAIHYQIEKRGFILEGYFADLTIVDLNPSCTVYKSNILSKCVWSHLGGNTFNSKVTQKFVNGNLFFDNGQFNEKYREKPLTKKRN